jgi:hypothetical protein
MMFFDPPFLTSHKDLTLIFDPGHKSIGLADEYGPGWIIMLSDVKDGGSLIGLAELRLIYLALNLVVILQVCLAVIHAF